MIKTYVLGSINKDFTYEVNRLPKPGETIMASSLEASTGGKGANQAVAIARNDIDTTLIACVNKADESIINEIKEFGVNTKFITKTDELPTGSATILLTEKDNSIVVNSGANSLINNSDVNMALLESNVGDYFVCQLEVPVEVVKHGLEVAKDRGLITFLNPSPAVNLPTDIYKNVDYLILNETEVEQLSLEKPHTDIGIYNIYKFFTGYGVKNIIITLGSEGACYLDGEDIYTMPAKDIDVVDTTGAGDAFLGGFVTAMANDIPLQESVVYANYAAALACSVEGALDSMPKKAYIISLINKDRIADDLKAEIIDNLKH